MKRVQDTGIDATLKKLEQDVEQLEADKQKEIRAVQEKYDAKIDKAMKLIEMFKDYSTDDVDGGKNKIREHKKEAAETGTEKSGEKDKTYTWYPFSGTAEEKVIAVFKKVGKCMRRTELIKEIAEVVGSEEKATMLASNYRIDKMVGGEQLFMCKHNGSKRHTFYAIPEFLERKKLKPKYFPIESAW